MRTHPQHLSRRALASIAAVATIGASAAPAAAQPAEPLPRLALLARDDVAVDALAAGPVAGALGVRCSSPRRPNSTPAPPRRWRRWHLTSS